MRGSVSKRGKSSWRIRFDLERGADGKRKQCESTFRGTRKEAEEELVRLLGDANAGTMAAPSRITVAEYLRQWIAGRTDLTPRSSERYGDIIERQAIPRIGHLRLQKLKPLHVKQWLPTFVPPAVVVSRYPTAVSRLPGVALALHYKTRLNSKCCPEIRPRQISRPRPKRVKSVS